MGQVYITSESMKVLQDTCEDIIEVTSADEVRSLHALNTNNKRFVIQYNTHFERFISFESLSERKDNATYVFDLETINYYHEQNMSAPMTDRQIICELAHVARDKYIEIYVIAQKNYIDFCEDEQNIDAKQYFDTLLFPAVQHFADSIDNVELYV